MMMRRRMKLMSNCHPMMKTPTTRVGPIRSLLYQIQIKSTAENDRMIQIMKGRLILDPFSNKPWFLCICCTSLLKTLWEKEKWLVSSNFSFSSQCFLSVLRSFCFFHQIGICCLQTLSIWKSLKFVVWERVKCYSKLFFIW